STDFAVVVDVTLDHAAVDGFERDRSDDGDVLADLGDELVALLLEVVDLLRQIGAVCAFEHALRKRAELLVLGNRLRLAADRDERSAVITRLQQDDALGRLATRTLRG